MILLVAVNVRLLLSPTAADKKSVPSDPLRSEFSYPAGANASLRHPAAKFAFPPLRSQLITQGALQRNRNPDETTDLPIRLEKKALKMLPQN